jgi:hypothetical protein
MSLTWAQVKTWRASDLDIYVGKVGVRLDVVDRQTEALQQLTLSLSGEGATSDALRRAVGKARWQLRNFSDELGDLQVALRNALFEVAEVAEAIKQVEKVAAGYGCVISQDGKVTWRDATSVQTESYRHGAEANLERMVARAIALADSADSTLNQKLSSFGTAPGKEPTKPGQIRDLSKAEQERFKNMSPEERAEYWSAQSDEQKRHLCDTYPEMIGNADGVEGWARDRANRLNLNSKEDQAKKDLVRYINEFNNNTRDKDKQQKIQIKIDRVKSDLAAYEKIRSTLANGISLEDYQHGKQGEPISLLTLQDDGRRVKAAVAQGDVDNAKHIATLVPGIGTTVEGGLDTNLRDTRNLRQAAATQGNIPLEDVATVAWLGYDAPGEPNMANAGDITSRELAEAGSDRLAGFMTGMHASRQYGAGDAHMTLVGHSYGSTTSGIAATKVKPGVIDDLALCGSPGMGTYDANDYRVDRNHLWVSGVPKGDSVQGIGAAGFRSVGYLGKNPMDADSGFTHLSGDATGSSKYNNDAPASVPIKGNFDNHSVYFDEGTETLQDFGRVVAGVKR